MGTIALWTFLVVVVAFYMFAVLGPPPPSAMMVMDRAFVMWLFFGRSIAIASILRRVRSAELSR